MTPPHPIQQLLPLDRQYLAVLTERHDGGHSMPCASVFYGWAAGRRRVPRVGTATNGVPSRRRERLGAIAWPLEAPISALS